MSSWQVIAKEMALLCIKSAGRTLANEISQKIMKKIEGSERVQNIQSKIKDGYGFDALSNVAQLFPKENNEKNNLN